MITNRELFILLRFLGGIFLYLGGDGDVPFIVNNLSLVICNDP